MHYVVCQHCKETIWKTEEAPAIGMTLRPEAFKGVHGYPDPKKHEKVACPACSKVPLLMHNEGIQMLTSTGDLLPCLPNKEKAEFLLYRKG